MDTKYIILLLASIFMGYVECDKGILVCNGTSMMLKFDKALLDGHNREYIISFYNASNGPCMVNSTDTTNLKNGSIWISADYHECGIGIFEEDGHIIYNQTVVITYGEVSPNPLIVRSEIETFDLSCQKGQNLTVNLEGEKINVTSTKGEGFTKVGSAKFDVDLDRYGDDKFQKIDESGEVELGKLLYFQLKVNTERKDIRISPQNCYATREDGTGKYELIKDKCGNPNDLTVKILKTNKKESNIFKWQVESFRYFGGTTDIFIHCDVWVCQTSSKDKRCDKCGEGVVGRKRRALSFLNQNGEDESPTIVSVQSAKIILIETDSTNKNSGEKIKKGAIFMGIEGTIIIALLAFFVLLVAIAVIRKLFLTAAAVEAPQQSLSMKVLESGRDNDAMQKEF